MSIIPDISTMFEPCLDLLCLRLIILSHFLLTIALAVGAAAVARAHHTGAMRERGRRGRRVDQRLGADGGGGARRRGRTVAL